MCRLRAAANIPHQDFIQINTSNILFICGGAFDNLEEIVAKRVEEKGRVGFNREHHQPAQCTPTEKGLAGRSNPTDEERQLIQVEREMRRRSALLHQLIPDDLLHYGLIPEFVGRLPVFVSLNSIDRAMMKRILVEPKNAIIKQFQRLFALDHVELVFTDDALEAAATEAFKRKTGARGLRTIIEETLLDVMYEIPSRPDIKKCVVNADTILHRQTPLLITQTDHSAPATTAALKETA